MTSYRAPVEHIRQDPDTILSPGFGSPKANQVMSDLVNSTATVQKRRFAPQRPGR